MIWVGAYGLGWLVTFGLMRWVLRPLRKGDVAFIVVFATLWFLIGVPFLLAGLVKEDV